MFGSKILRKTYSSPYGEKYIVVAIDYTPLIDSNNNKKRLNPKLRFVLSTVYAIASNLWDSFTEVPSMNQSQEEFNPLQIFRQHQARTKVIDTDLCLKGW